MAQSRLSGFACSYAIRYFHARNLSGLLKKTFAKHVVILKVLMITTTLQSLSMPSVLTLHGQVTRAPMLIVITITILATSTTRVSITLKTKFLFGCHYQLITVVVFHLKVIMKDQCVRMDQ